MFQTHDSSSSDDSSEEEMDTGSTPRVARKRKQLLKKSPNLSPTSSPSKRARKLKSPVPFQNGNSTAALSMSAPAKICQNNQASPALDLLESKKKVQRNSLYHWVLWREALRGEKDRANPAGSSPGAANPKARLSFSWKNVDLKPTSSKISVFFVLKTEKIHISEFLFALIFVWLFAFR